MLEKAFRGIDTLTSAADTDATGTCFCHCSSLGDGEVSIGDRYTSHRISDDRRAQYRSGGFAVQAFDEGLSLEDDRGVVSQIRGDVEAVRSVFDPRMLEITLGRALPGPTGPDLYSRPHG